MYSIPADDSILNAVNDWGRVQSGELGIGKAILSTLQAGLDMSPLSPARGLGNTAGKLKLIQGNTFLTGNRLLDVLKQNAIDTAIYTGADATLEYLKTGEAPLGKYLAGGLMSFAGSSAFAGAYRGRVKLEEKQQAKIDKTISKYEREFNEIKKTDVANQELTFADYVSKKIENGTFEVDGKRIVDGSKEAVYAMSMAHGQETAGANIARSLLDAIGIEQKQGILDTVTKAIDNSVLFKNKDGEFSAPKTEDDWQQFFNDLRIESIDAFDTHLKQLHQERNQQERTLQ